MLHLTRLNNKAALLSWSFLKKSWKALLILVFNCTSIPCTFVSPYKMLVVQNVIWWNWVHLLQKINAISSRISVSFLRLVFHQKWNTLQPAVPFWQEQYLLDYYQCLGLRVCFLVRNRHGDMIRFRGCKIHTDINLVTCPCFLSFNKLVKWVTVKYPILTLIEHCFHFSSINPIIIFFCICKSAVHYYFYSLITCIHLYTWKHFMPSNVNA